MDYVLILLAGLCGILVPVTSIRAAKAVERDDWKSAASLMMSSFASFSTTVFILLCMIVTKS